MLRYKACRKSIVTLELLDDTINNEKRDGIVNYKYAKFRCDKVKVISITEVKTGEKINSDISIFDENFLYNLGNVIANYFNENLNEVCTRGIHYFKTKEAALSWFYTQKNQKIPDGKWIKYHENGRKRREGTYKDGKLDGKWLGWHENGHKFFDGTDKDGKFNGKWIYWWDNGQKRSEGTYKDGKLDGKLVDWYSNGEKNTEEIYKDGKRVELIYCKDI